MLKVSTVIFQSFVIAFFLSTYCIFALGKENTESSQGDLIDDSLYVFKSDTNYSYQVVFPVRGYYELTTEFGSEKLFAEANKENRMLASNDYNGDTVKFQTIIYKGHDIVYQAEWDFVCSLNSFYTIFYFNTSRSKIPVGIPLQLNIKILRMDCQFPYDDVKFYISLHRAGFLR